MEVKEGGGEGSASAPPIDSSKIDNDPSAVLPTNDQEPEEINPNDFCPIRLIPMSTNMHLFGGLMTLIEGKIVCLEKFSRIRKIIQRMARAKERKKCDPSEFLTLEEMMHPQEKPHFLLTLDERYREKIWRILDDRSKHMIRLVNRVFKNEIEVSAGLEVVVNDEEEGNLEFIKSVEVTEACLLHLKNSYFRNNKQLFRCNWNIQTIDSWMQLNVVTFRHLVLDCSHCLECIYFREMALIRKYISASKADESQTYRFPHLTTILVYYGYFDTPAQNFKIFNANMRYILTTFDCPKLQNLQVLPEATVIDELVHEKRTILHESCRWESHPLKNFISKHHSTLLKLKLVLYRSFLSPETQTYHPPTKLVECILLFPMLEPVHAQHLRSFWRVITQSQVECQVISSQAELWGDFGSLAKGLRKNIFVFSALCLTKIFLESYHRKPAGEGDLTHMFDLKQFKTFHGLTELHMNVVQIGKKGDLFYIQNLKSLQRKIVVLILEGFQCLTSDLLYITEMPKLEKVAVKGCGTDGIYGVTFEVARQLLIHKTVQVVTFGGFNEKSDTRLLYALVKKFNMGKFDNEFEVVNPRDRISCMDWFPCCCCMKPHGEENINVH